MAKRPLKILLLLGEHHSWKGARGLSYHCNLGLEEALKANGVEVTTVMNPFLKQAPELLKGLRFDQVWAEVFVTAYLDDRVCDWMAGMAPVRLGLCAESTRYSEAELQVKPELATMAVRFRKRLPYLTHLALGDEVDPSRLGTAELATTWFLVSVNRRALSASEVPRPFRARFHGHVYGDRREWLDDPQLADVLEAAPHSEGGMFELSFDLWKLAWMAAERFTGKAAGRAIGLYLRGSRQLRRQASKSWQDQLASSSAVVSLPLIFKSFPGRVTEAMAVARPVLCWRVPRRPRLLRVFEPEKELLFFSTPTELRERLLQLRAEPSQAAALGANAYRCVKARHTTEYRVRQLLDWVETGDEPFYG